MGTSTVRLRPGGAAGGHRTGRWVCIPVALAVLVATLLAWRALAARERSPLPEIVLVKGLLLAVSLGAAVYLAQTARQRTQAAEAAREELEAEIAERKRAERQQHARVAQQRAVAELGQRALAGAGLQALLDEAVRSVAAALELEYAKVLELLPGGEALRLRAGVGWKEGLVGQATVGAELDSQAGYTLLTRDPVIVDDLRRETRFTGPPLLREHGVVSGLSVVIAGQNGPFGVLGAHTRQPRKFTADDAHFLQSVANVLATALARQQAEQHLDQCFEVSRDLLCIAGTDTYFKRVNPAFQRILGYTPEEMKAVPFLDFVHPDDREPTVREVEKLARGEYSATFANRYRAKDGAWRWLLWNSAPIAERQLIFAAARDVTEQRAAEEALRKAHDELEFRVQERTAELKRANQELVQNIDQRKRSEEQIALLNHELERRVAELTAVNKELEAFTYSVSHDLRAPLRHIGGFARILVEEAGPSLHGDAQRCLERIREGAQQMGRMVDDLLTLSRMGRRELNRQLTGLYGLVAEVIAELKPETQEREIEFCVGELPFADCDPALIKQVFANLLANAVKFTRPRKHAVIEIGRTEAGGQTAVFVRDNGVGFSMKYADKLFGVFQRLHRKEDFEGTGVGLATVHHIIQRHGGQVWAEAELDRGATFYFTLGGVAGDQNEQACESIAGG